MLSLNFGVECGPSQCAFHSFNEFSQKLSQIKDVHPVHYLLGLDENKTGGYLDLSWLGGSCLFAVNILE